MLGLSVDGKDRTWLCLLIDRDGGDRLGQVLDGDLTTCTGNVICLLSGDKNDILGEGRDRVGLTGIGSLDGLDVGDFEALFLDRNALLKLLIFCSISCVTLFSLAIVSPILLKLSEQFLHT